MKSLSVDEGLPVSKENGILISRLNGEDGHLKIENSDHDLPSATRLRSLRATAAQRSPLRDQYVVIRNDYVEFVAEIHARGAGQ
jgi:hypothetical protein